MYVLNIKKGTIIQHPAVGKLEGGVAYNVTDEEAQQLKHIINIIVFERVENRLA